MRGVSGRAVVNPATDSERGSARAPILRHPTKEPLAQGQEYNLKRAMWESVQVSARIA